MVLNPKVSVYLRYLNDALKQLSTNEVKEWMVLEDIILVVYGYQQASEMLQPLQGYYTSLIDDEKSLFKEALRQKSNQLEPDPIPMLNFGNGDVLNAVKTLSYCYAPNPLHKRHLRDSSILSHSLSEKNMQRYALAIDTYSPRIKLKASWNGHKDYFNFRSQDLLELFSLFQKPIDLSLEIYDWGTIQDKDFSVLKTMLAKTRKLICEIPSWELSESESENNKRTRSFATWTQLELEQFVDAVSQSNTLNEIRFKFSGEGTWLKHEGHFEQLERLLRLPNIRSFELGVSPLDNVSEQELQQFVKTVIQIADKKVTINFKYGRNSIVVNTCAKPNLFNLPSKGNEEKEECDPNIEYTPL